MSEVQNTEKVEIIDVDPDSELDTQADQFVGKLIQQTDQTLDSLAEESKQLVEKVGTQEQASVAKQSALLKQPIHTLSKKSDDGGEVANALVNLKMKVEELDPAKIDLTQGWFSRMLGHLPGVGTPIKRYFSRYESAQTIIGSIVHSLEAGKAQLLRDNVTLTEDQKSMRISAGKLSHMIQFAIKVDQKLQHKLDREIEPSDPKHRFVSEELMFPLRQRIQDMQQQLAVNQQGVMAVEIIVRSNKELARSVSRALNVTITALEVGATVAMALANQKIVIDKVNSVNKTTSDLISGTAERLKTQGAEIYKQAASQQLDMNALVSAFEDIKTAIEDVSTFRSKALPEMAEAITKLDKLSSDAEKEMDKLEKGRLEGEVK